MTEADKSHISNAHNNRSFTDDELVAQCFIFFAVGFEPASTLVSFIAYELALDQDIQQKAYEEVERVNTKLNGDLLSYATLSESKYLDQIVSEALRKWPLTVAITRRCSRDYEFNLNGNKIVIERGKLVAIPICSIQNDPALFEKPENSETERFSDENEHKIEPEGTGILLTT